MTHDDQVSATYGLAGFGRRSGVGRRPAVVVVDFINGFTDPAYATGSAMDAEVAHCAELLRAARAATTPIAYTTLAFDGEDDAVTWWRKAPSVAALQLGTPAVELDERLEARPGERLIVKRGPSAFHGTDLHSWLVQHEADTVIVCGATTSGCVRATVVDAVQNGFVALVPADCVADRAAGPHEASLFDIDQKYGDVIDLRQAVQIVSRAA